jgi:hypothetical protein
LPLPAQVLRNQAGQNIHPAAGGKTHGNFNRLARKQGLHLGLQLGLSNARAQGTAQAQSNQTISEASDNTSSALP